MESDAVENAKLDQQRIDAVTPRNHFHSVNFIRIFHKKNSLGSNKFLSKIGLVNSINLRPVNFEFFGILSRIRKSHSLSSAWSDTRPI